MEISASVSVWDRNFPWHFKHTLSLSDSAAAATAATGSAIKGMNYQTSQDLRCNLTVIEYNERVYFNKGR